MHTHALYEALLFEPGRGYFLLWEHLDRLGQSARFFGYALDLDAVAAALLHHGQPLETPTKVRLSTFADGRFALENAAVKPSTPLCLALASTPVDSRDPFLRHKTSRREVYQRASAAHPDADDVLLYNERGELTETTAGNIVLELQGERLTPHTDAGLLPGTYRRHLLTQGALAEARLTLSDLGRATRLWMINSVRRTCDASLIEWRAA